MSAAPARGLERYVRGDPQVAADSGDRRPLQPRSRFYSLRLEEVIFVDAGVWFARYVRTDVDHARARTWFTNIKDTLVTSDYVIDELLTLLRSRGHTDVALRVGGNLHAALDAPLQPLLL
ncbi:MAG: hypothetical protein DCC67_03350 [Planctomycetota bacterium]|nr:MAG: hypothetical protein DCC67_03350 [Planctomycetota bacterium]